MSVTLDPIVVSKLSQFSQRRRRLLLARGLSAGLATGIVCFAAIGAIDWYWLLSDSTRWALSGSAYLLIAIVVWLSSVRQLMHSPARELIASQVEQGEPELREKLLSAVELATDDPASLHDSPAFRSLLQGEVAQQMGRVQVARLLPFKLVTKWVVVALLLVGIAGLLLSSGDVRFRQLATRAFLPGANVARVSRIQVEILEPTPHSLILAEDETVAIVVAISGGDVKEVTLETSSPKKGIVREPMRPRTENEFGSNVHIADESIEYRIFAGDAITQRFSIESRPRPRVKQFQKTYDYPEYSLLPDETITEPQGDLLVLEGTQAELILELDQDVTTAELRIDAEDSDELRIVPLTRVSADPADKLFWKTTLPVEQAAIYKVHLVSRETGFENIFSPKYEIRPQPDLIPRAGFVDQEFATLLLPPNDLVALKGMAEDDLPLVSLEQYVSINGREWEPLPLEMVPVKESDGREVRAAWQWDLVPHVLNSGDQVLTKLVATDRKGNTGESIPLRIVVAAPEYDPTRHQVMERKLALYEKLEKFAETVAQQHASAAEVIEKLKVPEADEETRLSARTTLLDLASKQREQSSTLLTEINAVTRDMPAGADAYDLELTGRIVARIERDHAALPVFLLEVMQNSADQKQYDGDLKELASAFKRSDDEAQNLRNQYQQFVAHNFLWGLASDLETLHEQQQLVVDNPTQSWERLTRQEAVVVEHLEDLERLLQSQRGRLHQSLDNRIVQTLSWSESARSRFSSAMESEEKLKDLQRLSTDFLRELGDRQRVDAWDGGVPGKIVNARKDLERRAGGLHEPLEQLGRAIQEENKIALEASAADDSQESRQRLEQAKRFMAEFDLKQRPRLQQFRSQKDLTQARPDADNQYASDVGLTLRAANHLARQHRTVAVSESQLPEHFQEIAPAYRTLEAGHQLIRIRNAVNLLLPLERWNTRGLSAVLDHPRQWDVVQQGFELTSQRLREARVENGLIQKLDQLRWSQPVRDANRKITERRWKRDLIVGAGHEVMEVREQLDELITQLEPKMVEAREIISKYAPTIPQMAKQAAEQVRELEEQTLDTADELEQSAEAKQELAALEQQQEQANQQIEELLEALVEEANTQDLFDEQQQQRARDADDSIALIQPPAQQMNRSLEQAKEAPESKQQAKELAQTAERQEQTAEALELVAEHFDKLATNQDVAETREKLRQQEREQGIARQQDQKFEEVSRLSEMAQQDAQELMKELEAELKQNPAMQQALSEISRDTLENAQAALELAALDEQNLQRANELGDEAFRQKKRDLSEELRELGSQSQRLSREFVQQANVASSKGKDNEAREKLAAAQQKLNEAGSKAQSAREDQLLADLNSNAKEIKDALREASELLKQAKSETNQSKNEKIHADDKQRETAKKDAEKQRKDFHEQLKRSAKNEVNRAEQLKKRDDQQVRNAENQVRNMQRQVQQAEQQLKKKPDDNGLKQNLARQQDRKASEEQKLAAAKTKQQQSEQNARETKQAEQEIIRKPMPVLNAANPAAELADEMTSDALKIAEELNRQVDQIAKNGQFEKELSPPQNRLTASREEQENVKQDVQQTAEDVARAARHERRLDNEAAAEPLAKSAQQIEAVANNETTQAGTQLEQARAEAEQAEAKGESKHRPNQQTLQAQAALQTSENALANQAEQLNATLEPLLAAAENPQGEQSEGEPANADSPAGTPPQGDSQSGSAPPAQGKPATGKPTSPAISPEQQARGQQLAQMLDELDRRQAAASKNGETPQAPLDTLAQAAKAQQATLAQSRQAQVAQALSENATDPTGTPTETGPMGEFQLLTLNRNENREWGKLRNKSAEDVTTGRTDAVSEDYRKSVETYFKVLAERARKTK